MVGENYQKITLKNGLRLMSVPMPAVGSTTVLVAVAAGSRYETRRVNGLFHFLEHMAFKGTQKRPTTLEISSEVESVGGEFNAATSKDITSYYLKVAAKHQRLAFDILADILTNSLFKEEEIEREKGVIIEEINMIEDTPIRAIDNYFEELLYGDNPMGWNVAGKKETVRGLKRNDFLKVFQALYFPKNMVIAVAGKFEKTRLEPLAEEFFGGLKNVKKSQPKSIKIDQRRPRLKLVTKKTEQAHFILGVPGFWYSHPDRFVLGVLATILGGGMSSRLFTEIRERRGLAYYVSAHPEFYTDSGYLIAQAGVRLKAIDEAIKVVLNQLDDLRNKKVNQKELKKAKEFLKGRLILALEDSYLIASRYAGQLLLEEKIRTTKETLALIDKVMVEEMQGVAKKLFKPEKLNLAVIGPYKDGQRFERLLKL